MIYGNKARNISESSYDAATSKVLREIRELDEEVTKAANEMEFIQSYNEAGMLYMTEGEMGDKSKGLFSKIADATKKVLTKSGELAKNAMNNIAKKVEDAKPPKELIDKAEAKMVTKCHAGRGFATTKYPGLFTTSDPGDNWNKLINSTNDIDSIIIHYGNDCWSAMVEIDDNNNLKDKLKEIEDKAKEEIDKKYDDIKSLYDSLLRESDEQKVKVSSGVCDYICSMMRGNLGTKSETDEYISKKDKFIKQRLDKTEKELKELEARDKDSVDTKWAIELRTEYNITSYGCQKSNDTTRMAVSYNSKEWSEYKKAFMNITGKKDDESNGEE